MPAMLFALALVTLGRSTFDTAATPGRPEWAGRFPPALIHRHGDAGASRQRSHAGAWERSLSCPLYSPSCGDCWRCPAPSKPDQKLSCSGVMPKAAEIFFRVVARGLAAVSIWA